MTASAVLAQDRVDAGGLGGPVGDDDRDRSDAFFHRSFPSLFSALVLFLSKAMSADGKGLSTRWMTPWVKEIASP